MHAKKHVGSPAGRLEDESWAMRQVAIQKDKGKFRTFWAHVHSVCFTSRTNFIAFHRKRSACVFIDCSCSESAAD